jgi:hypothetical protein
MIAGADSYGSLDVAPAIAALGTPHSGETPGYGDALAIT